MKLQWITFDLDCPSNVALTSSWVEQSIATMGQPLRWSITEVVQGRCLIEAVILTQEA